MSNLDLSKQLKPASVEYAPYLKKPKEDKELKQVEIKESEAGLSVINLTFPLKVEKKTNYQTKRARVFPHKPEKCLVETKEQAEMPKAFNISLKETKVYHEEKDSEMIEQSKQNVTPNSVKSIEDVLILFKQQEEHAYNEEEFTDEEEYINIEEEDFNIKGESELEEIPIEEEHEETDSKSSMESSIKSVIVSEIDNNLNKYSDSIIKIHDYEVSGDKSDIEKSEDEKKISETQLSMKLMDDAHGKQNQLSLTLSQEDKTIQIMDGHKSFESVHELEEETATQDEARAIQEETRTQEVEGRTSYESAQEFDEEKTIQIVEAHFSFESAHKSEEDNVIQVVEGQASLESHENEKQEHVPEISESDQINPIEITLKQPRSHEKESNENTKDLTALYKKPESSVEPETSSSESGVFITKAINSQLISSSSKSETMKINLQPEIKAHTEIISENDEAISKYFQRETFHENEMPIAKQLADETERIYSEETFENNLTQEFIKRKHLESLYFPLKRENRRNFKDDPIGMLKLCYKYMVDHRFSNYSIFSLRMLYRISLAGFTNLTKLCVNFGYIADGTGDTLLSIGAIREGKLRDLVLLCPRDEMPSFNRDKFTAVEYHVVPDFAWRKARILCPSLCAHLILLAMPRYNVSSKFMSKNTPLRSFQLSTGYRGVKAHQFKLWYFDMTLKNLCNYSATLVSLSFHIWHSRERLDNLIKKLLIELKNLEKFEYYGTFQYIRTIEDICNYFLQNNTKMSHLAIFKIEDPCTDCTKLAEEMEKRRLKFLPFFEKKGIVFEMGTFWL